MDNPSQSSPPSVALEYISKPLQRPSNWAGYVGFVLGFVSIAFFLGMIASVYIPILGVALPLFFLLWICCALGALIAGTLGLLNARRLKSLRRDYAWVALIIGGLTFLMILAALLAAIHYSDTLLSNYHS
jgi:hypothetical protein